jgi:hypothetical protein
MVITAAQGAGTLGSRARRRVRWRWPDRATTPGRLWQLLIGLVLLSVAWGALAAFTGGQYASATGAVSSRELLSLDAQQIYSRLSDANDTAATAFLAGGLEPAAARQRYLTDLAAASTAIQGATARVGAGAGAASADLNALAEELPVYSGEIETARADNGLGLPLGAAYLREASALMRGTLLIQAKDLYTRETASLGDTSARATGLPLLAVTVAAGLLVGYLLLRASRWLRQSTNRVLNLGLLGAGVAVIVSLAWLGAVYASARGDLLSAQAHGSATVEAVAQVSIAAQEAHTDESLTLIDNAGDDQYQADYQSEQRLLGPGQRTLLTTALAAATGSPAASAVTAAVSDAQAWYTAHAKVRALDDNGNHASAVASVLGTQPGDAGASFTRLSLDLTQAVDEDQAVYNATAPSASGAYTGVEPGVILLALLMAGACAWGLTKRIAEYR